MGIFKSVRYNGMATFFQNSVESLPLMPMTEKENNRNQYLAAIVANIIGIAWGTAIGWSSPAIAKMENFTDSPLDFVPTAEEFSWIGSVLPLGGLAGAVFCAPLPHSIGRKWSLMLNALSFAASFIILIVTNDIISIYVARFLQGWGSGVVMVILPMYTGEIASASCRGILSSFIQIGLVFGILYAYVIGPYVSYITFQCLCFIIPVIFIFAFSFFPDSPHYYITKGDHVNAIKSLEYLRGKTGNAVTTELVEIELSLRHSMRHKARVLDIFKGRANIIATTIGVGLICFQNLSGIDAVLFYSETIFHQAGSSLDSAIATIIIGVVMLISSLISPFFVDSSGRKVLLLISAAGMAVSLAIMGIHFFLDSRDLMAGFGWIPVTALVAFILFYCVGFGPLPFTILGEMFAPEIKSAATSFAIATCWIADFGVTKAFLPLESVVGNYGNFWIFGGFCVAALVFTATAVFETRGLTLDEIQERLNGRKSSSL